jgi:hypothetical protein
MVRIRFPAESSWSSSLSTTDDLRFALVARPASRQRGETRGGRSLVHLHKIDCTRSTHVGDLFVL